MKIVAVTSDVTLPYGSPCLRVIADSALLKGGKPFFLPDFAPEFRARASLALRIGRLGKNVAPRFAHRYIDAVAAALHIEADPAECPCPYSFDGAAVFGEMMAPEDAPAAFTLEGGSEPIEWRADAVEPDAAGAVALVSRYMTIKTGDLILAGLTAESVPLNIGMHLSARSADRVLLDLKIK